ncbi:hypothetical protein V6N12_074820 [Hibiscus sabdariffa]|uniref:Uncharacterized protein n=1 Tax=Hibiscus sabdariffa TaxID=183260 RepID=A0ABR2D2J7_9ROSI
MGAWMEISEGAHNQFAIPKGSLADEVYLRDNASSMNRGGGNMVNLERNDKEKALVRFGAENRAAQNISNSSSN